MGELLAPPQDSPRGTDWKAVRLGEIKSLIKADKADEALQLLERTGRLQQDEIDCCDERDGLNLLHVASAANAVKLVIELLNAREASVNHQSTKTAGRNTPLHYASINGHANLVDLLLRYGADPSLPNDRGHIPLEIAEASLQAPPRSLLQNRTELVDSILSPTALFHQRSSALVKESGAESDKLAQEVLVAARETAQAMNADATLKKYRSTLFVTWIYPDDRRRGDGRGDGKTVAPEAKETLRRFPALATGRTEADTMRGYCDGYTPLHAAASVGYCEMIELLLTLPGVSAWCRDPQGKTPLHVAAENAGKCDSATVSRQGREYERACSLLRQAMKAERGGLDPVGEDAPLDLAGNTPLGCFALREATLKEGLKRAVFSPGDRSTLPTPSPVPERSGCSPWRRSPVPSPAYAVAPSEDGAQFVYAFSEARGFKRQMEDFVVARCPLDGALPSWSIFGVCDGHGGAGASKFLSARFPQELLRLSKASVHDHLAADEPAVLRRLLEEACAAAEQAMRESEPFRVEVFQRESDSGQPAKLGFRDSSGSTGLFCLATHGHLAVANVGDSRAVLAQLRPQVGSKSGSSSGSSSCSSSSEAALVSPRSDAHAPASCLTATALSVDANFGALDERGHLMLTPAQQEAQARVVKAGAK